MVLRLLVSFTIAVRPFVDGLRLVGLRANPGDTGESPIDRPLSELGWPSLASSDGYRRRGNRLLRTGEGEP